MSAPCARNASAWPIRSTPITPAKPPGVTRRHARERVLKDGCLIRPDTEAACSGQERVGSGLSLQMIAFGDHAIDRSSNRSSMPAATITSRQFVLEETTARFNPASRAAWTYRTEPA